MPPPNGVMMPNQEIEKGNKDWKLRIKILPENRILPVIRQ
jgi:hypothetical protein